MTNKEAITFFDGLIPENGLMAEATRMAIEALKQQGKLKEQEEVVRCKDCKSWNNNGIITKCEKHIGNGYPGDWFCADGERRADNA